ncbi:MAG: hypothetical protein ABJ215_10730 [Alphaproteobacteria bacterium]
MKIGQRAFWLIVAGLVAVNYAYLHDIIWQSHRGLVVMGLKSYGLAILGTVMILAGVVMARSGD